jgi:hypothetical protein
MAVRSFLITKPEHVEHMTNSVANPRIVSSSLSIVLLTSGRRSALLLDVDGEVAAVAGL